MKLIKGSLTILSFSLFITNAFSAQNNTLAGYYVGIQTGYSISLNTNVHPQNDYNWSAAYQDFDSRIGNSMLYAVKAGCKLKDLFAADISYTYQPGYRYSKEFPADPATQPSGLKRSFDLSTQALMANGYLYARGLFSSLQLDSFDPYIGAGLGYAWNKTGNLDSLNYTTGSTHVLYGATIHSFAWQMMLGSQVTLNKSLALDLGYRFNDLGNFATSEQGIGGDASRLQVKNARANQLYLGMNYYF